MGKHPGHRELLDATAGALTTNHILEMRNSVGPTKLTKWHGCEAVTKEYVRDMKTHGSCLILSQMTQCKESFVFLEIKPRTLHM